MCYAKGAESRPPEGSPVSSGDARPTRFSLQVIEPGLPSPGRNRVDTGPLAHDLVVVGAFVFSAEVGFVSSSGGVGRLLPWSITQRPSARL
jgi:hypothetical protein